jgi:hypothetical protein
MPSVPFHTVVGSGKLGKGSGFVEAADGLTQVLGTKFDAGFVGFDDLAIAAIIDFYRLNNVIDTQGNAIFPVIFGTAFNVCDANDLVLDHATGCGFHRRDEAEEENEYPQTDF